MLTIEEITSGINSSFDRFKSLFVRSLLRWVAPRHAHATESYFADLEMAGGAAERDGWNA